MDNFSDFYTNGFPSWHWINGIILGMCFDPRFLEKVCLLVRHNAQPDDLVNCGGIRRPVWAWLYRCWDRYNVCLRILRNHNSLEKFQLYQVQSRCSYRKKVQRLETSRRVL